MLTSLAASRLPNQSVRPVPSVTRVIMRAPELAHVNLNVLVALDALLDRRNVGQAAERVGVTQSAMSHTLRHLRALFDDPLLVRAGNHMVLTPRGESIAAPLREALLQVQALVVAEAPFDPGSATRRFTLAASDAAVLVVAPRLLAVLAQVARGIELDIIAVDRTRLAEMLEEGVVDLALMPGGGEVSGLDAQRLYPTSFAVLACRDNPEVGATLDLDTYCRLPHALVGLGDSGPGLVDALLERRGRTRRVVVRVPYFSAGPATIVGSSRLLTVPRSAAEHFASHYPLRLFDPPLAFPRADVAMVWHERVGRDPAHRWLREQMLAVTHSLRARRSPDTPRTA